MTAGKTIEVNWLTRERAVRGAQFLVILLLALCLGPLGGSLPTAARAETILPRLNLDEVSDPIALNALKEGTNLLVMSLPGGEQQISKAEFTDADMAVERERLAGILKALGYLDAEVAHVGGEFVPKPGPLYRLGLVTIDGVQDGSLTPAGLDSLAYAVLTSIGQPARGDVIGALEKTILGRLNQAGFPFAETAQKRLLTGDWPELATFDLKVKPGVRAYFGQVLFTGNYRTKSEDLARYMPFSAGEPFDPTMVELLEERLKAAGLFWTAQADYGDAPTPDGRLDITVKVREKTESSQVLAETGRVGLVTSVIGLALLAVAQVLTATGAPSSMRRTVLGISFIAFAICMVMAVQRVLMLLGV